MPATPSPRRVTLIVAAAGLTLTAGLLAPTPQAAARETRAEFDGPVFEDGLSQPVFDATPESWIRQELWVEAAFDSDRDGRRDRIHVSLARPKETETDDVKVPVIYEDSPYYAGLTSASNWAVDHALGHPPATRPGTPAYETPSTSPIISRGYESRWIPRGFAVVHSESPGSGLSDGCATSGAPNESLAAKAVVEWLGGRARGFATRTGTTPVAEPDWTTGDVGMTGTSYNGTLPIGVASTGVPNLKAIIPVSAISSWYGYYRQGGAVRAPGGYQGEDLDVLADAVNTRSDRAVCDGVLREIVAKQDRVTGDYSRFWDERNYLRDARKIKAATLVAHGLNDDNVMPDQATNLYEQLKARGVPHQIYLHQGGHGGPPTDELMNRWFTRYLWKHQNGVEQRPKAYVVRGDDSRDNPTAYAEWPIPGTRQVTLRTSGDGSGLGELSRRARPGLRPQRIVDDASIGTQELVDADTSPHRLSFATEPLAHDVRISGAASVRTLASFGASRANATALLVQYDADGTATILSRAWLDPRNVLSPSHEIPLHRGVPLPLRFTLQPKDTVVPAGARIGLVLMSSDADFTVRPPAGTTMDVSTALTSLTLPVLGAADLG